MNNKNSPIREIRRRRLPQTVALYVLGAWVLMQVSDVLFPGAGIPDYAIRYVFFGAVALFPVVLVFGWRYNFTAGGIRRTDTSTGSDTVEQALTQQDRAILLVLGIVGVAIVGAALYPVISLRGATAPDTVAASVADNSIAVLPFEDMSDSVGEDYFGAGIAEQLLNELAGIQSLRVAARTSSFRFRDQPDTMQSIGRQLGVATILDGSVRRAGNQLRVSVQLINTADGYQLWSKNYDSETGNIFEIQENIARAIADALEVEILGAESRRLATAPTSDFEAYDFFLLGSHHRDLRNEDSIERAIEYFQRAVDTDPDFALGYVGLASCYVYQVYHAGVDQAAAERLATPYLEQALDLDPELADAYSALGSVRLMVRDFVAAEQNYLRAIELSPNNSSSWFNLGFIRVLQSRLIEAETAYEQSRKLDRLNNSLIFNMAALKMLRGNYEEGLADFERVRELAPERSDTPRAIIFWSRAYGDYVTSAEWIERTGENGPYSDNTIGMLGMLFNGLGLWDKSLPLLERAYAERPDAFFDDIADLYHRSGDGAGLHGFMTTEYPRSEEDDPARFAPANRLRAQWRGLAAYLNHDYGQAARDFLLAAGGESGIADAVYDETIPIQYLAMTYSKLDRNDEASVLLRQCDELARAAFEQGWNTPAIYNRRARTSALQGHTDDALQLLQAAVNKGWLIAGELEHDPVWSTLHEDSRFVQLIEDVNSSIRDQHDLVLDVTERD